MKMKQAVQGVMLLAALVFLLHAFGLLNFIGFDKIALALGFDPANQTSLHNSLYFQTIVSLGVVAAIYVINVAARRLLPSKAPYLKKKLKFGMQWANSNVFWIQIIIIDLLVTWAIAIVLFVFFDFMIFGQAVFGSLLKPASFAYLFLAVLCIDRAGLNFYENLKAELEKSRKRKKAKELKHD